MSTGTVVLVQGAFDDSSSWGKVISLLMEKGYKVVSVQNPPNSVAEGAGPAQRSTDMRQRHFMSATESQPYDGGYVALTGEEADYVYVAQRPPAPRASEPGNDAAWREKVVDAILRAAASIQ